MANNIEYDDRSRLFEGEGDEDHVQAPPKLNHLGPYVAESKNSRNAHIRGSHSEKPQKRQKNALAAENDHIGAKVQGYQGAELKEGMLYIRTISHCLFILIGVELCN